jgi:hypothetical protein
MVRILTVMESELFECAQRRPGINGRVPVMPIGVRQQPLCKDPGYFTGARVETTAHLRSKRAAAFHASSVLAPSENSKHSLLLHGEYRERGLPVETRLKEELRRGVVRGKIGVGEAPAPGLSQSLLRKPAKSPPSLD